MLILVNQMAAGGRGSYRWKKVLQELKNRGENFFATREAKEIMKFYENGERHFIAAGGDGTVNLVASILINNLTEDQLQGVTLGAIGIGSSNDYHKTSKTQDTIAGFPCRIGIENAVYRDVLIIKSASIKQYALLNIGIGFTAKANLVFNKDCGIVAFLKKISSSLAIFTSVLKTVFTHSPQNYTVSVGADIFRLPLTNVNILKSPHVASGFSYPYPFVANSGNAAIYLLQNRFKWSLLTVLAELSQNHFTLSEYKKQMRLTEGNSFRIMADQSFPLEFDGEICETNDVSITIKKNMLRCC